MPTVFENYITYPIHPPSGKIVELALWDTAGQEEYDRLRPLSYPETDLIFVCFAIDCPNSLDNVLDKVGRRPHPKLPLPTPHPPTDELTTSSQWYPEVLHFCPYTPLFLVGLKSDLRHKKACIEMLKTQGLTPVTTDQGLAVSKKMGARYMECSSKEMRGVDEIFNTAILTVVANDRRNIEAQMAAASRSSGGGGRGGSSGGGRAGSSSGGGGVVGGMDAGGFVQPKRKKKLSCKIL